MSDFPEKLTAEQRSHLPDLVALAMIGFALLKADKSASEWSHPAIAAFRKEAEPVLDQRREASLRKWADKWVSDLRASGASK